MFKNKEISRLDDFFNERVNRMNDIVYFCRFNGYSEAIKNFILQYYEAARTSGVIIEGKIPNPDEKNLSYYDEIMGLNFEMSVGFLTASLKKWLPRMNDYQRSNVATSLFDTLDEMRKEGKNDNMLKNAYIKFMCWLYYKFERIVNQLGENKIPKILYEGDISNYELKLIAILSKSGCDVVLLQYNGDNNYLKLDPRSKLSLAYNEAGMQEFPPGFNIKCLRKEQENNLKVRQLYGTLPQMTNCTNAWMSGAGLEDILKSVPDRGNDSKLFYNGFIRINGVEDKLTYINELFQFQLQIKSNQRKLVVVENQIEPPSMEEISEIRRNHYQNKEQMILDLTNNIQYTANLELQRLMNKAYIDVVIEESKKEELNLNKLTNKAVYLLCWLKRYQKFLFMSWKNAEIACFIYLGGCKNEYEALFLRLLAKLPVDVIILVPNRNQSCLLQDKMLYEINYTESLAVDKFPVENASIHMGTAAYHAERELDTLMYQDSGMYRNMQYDKAVSLTLQTMYEEIAILWDQELKYRPNFSTLNGIVNIPVIFSKISGVKDSMVTQYWDRVKELITNDTLVVKNKPIVKGTDSNPIKPFVTEFLKNKRLMKEKIKAHKAYPYSVLRDESQEHILDKLQALIEQRLIQGTFENGTEYTIIATVLNLNKDIIRMIQKFDFTKKNPKMIYINTTESTITLEDSIITAFLNLLGFDVLFFIPTGYQNVERFFTRKLMEEYQIGEYMYDLQIPNFDTLSSNPLHTWREKLFKRGS
ncbi:YceG-like Ter operon protein [Lachnotalea glycerini]|uniref:YceG-like Ter operon protein n=1 Tax=Lachnotalea glycerini TaxID=1763509 RepID=A0A318EPL7_9FIRM|nr:YceG family protein [Lachnotalea glycerini]PXV93415.1 YceG-like Ter operon protein [Lachnotalea glycerini]